MVLGKLIEMKNIKIAIIGLGYVGLPLARLFATKYPVVGFDINEGRVSELMSGTDSTLEVSDDVLQQRAQQIADAAQRLLNNESP